jgi:hypothetical protein
MCRKINLLHTHTHTHTHTHIHTHTYTHTQIYVDVYVLEELQALSHQLEQMNIQFTAWGFFVLNQPLLCTVIGGIFTYILIMI